MSDGDTLGTLIQSRRGKRSYRDLEALSGGSPGASRWAQLARDDRMRTAPDIDLLKTIAGVLGVTERTVWLAVGRSLGIDLTGEESTLIARMPAGTAALSEAQADAVIAVIDQFVVASTGGGVAASEPEENVRPLRAARRRTGAESRGERGSTRRT